MSRWEPNARGRLEQAALDLYIERGFDRTTVAEIAKRAGLTERTFFRHFADKREVLFGSGRMGELLAEAVADAPDTASPIAAVGAGLDAVALLLQERRAHSQRRQSVITANPELRERELIKLASLADTMAEALRLRGVAELPARLAAEAGIAVFRIAFESWVGASEQRDLATVIRDALDQFKGVVGETLPPAAPASSAAGRRSAPVPPR